MQAKRRETVISVNEWVWGSRLWQQLNWMRMDCFQLRTANWFVTPAARRTISVTDEKVERRQSQRKRIYEDRHIRSGIRKKCRRSTTRLNTAYCASKNRSSPILFSSSKWNEIVLRGVAQQRQENVADGTKGVRGRWLVMHECHKN